MPRVTQKQRKLADVIIENSKVDKPLNSGQMLEKVGYAKNVIEAKPGEIIASEGVQFALVEKGFDPYTAKKVVQEIMLDRNVNASARLKATDQVFKVFGSYAEQKTTSLNLNIDTKIEDKTDLELVRQQFEEQLKQKLHENN